jgi:hypothetical protein
LGDMMGDRVHKVTSVVSEWALDGLGGEDSGGGPELEFERRRQVRLMRMPRRRARMARTAKATPIMRGTLLSTWGNRVVGGVSGWRLWWGTTTGRAGRYMAVQTSKRGKKSVE